MFLRLGETYFNMGKVHALFVDPALEGHAGSRDTVMLYFTPRTEEDDTSGGVRINLLPGQIETLYRWLDRADPEFNPDITSREKYDARVKDRQDGRA